MIINLFTYFTLSNRAQHQLIDRRILIKLSNEISNPKEAATRNCLPFRGTWVNSHLFVGSCYSNFSCMCMSFFSCLVIVLSVLPVSVFGHFSLPWDGINNMTTLNDTNCSLPLLQHLGSLPVLTWVLVSRSLLFCEEFCRLLLVHCLLAIVLSVLLRFTDSDYPFGIFKLFLLKR